MPSLSWLNVFKVGLPILALLGIAFWLFSWGLEEGRADVQAQWDQDKLQHQAVIEAFKAELEHKEAVNREQSRQIAEQLASVEADHARSVSALHAGFAVRLRNSEDRATVYQRMSEAGTAERSDLASHAAELDRALEEGRLLVGELRSTLVQREQQLRLVGEQLLADRRLINTEPGTENTGSPE